MTESFWVSSFNPSPFDAHMRIIAHVQSGSRVMDVGCNTGELGEQLKKRLNCHVVGVEMQPGAAELARTRLDAVICSDVMALPEQYPPLAQFDYVLAATFWSIFLTHSAPLNFCYPIYGWGEHSSFRCPMSPTTQYVFCFSLGALTMMQIRHYPADTCAFSHYGRPKPCCRMRVWRWRPWTCPPAYFFGSRTTSLSKGLSEDGSGIAIWNI